MESFNQDNFPEVGELRTNVYYVLGIKKEDIPVVGKLKVTQISTMEAWKVGCI